MSSGIHQRTTLLSRCARIVSAATVAPSNIVRLPGPPALRAPAPLSGIERDAFRRIAEALGTRAPESAETSAAEAASEPAPRAAQSATAAETIDVRVIDRLPLGIVIFRDGRTLFANRTLIDLLGYASADAFAQSGGAEAVFPNGDAIAERIAAARILLDGDPLRTGGDQRGEDRRPVEVAFADGAHDGARIPAVDFLVL